jgi:hypothetical protein
MYPALLLLPWRWEHNARALAFPSYDGNGMFKNLDNVLVNPHPVRRPLAAKGGVKRLRRVSRRLACSALRQ